MNCKIVKCGMVVLTVKQKADVVDVDVAVN
jgi:hypothetical protein